MNTLVESCSALVEDQHGNLEIIRWLPSVQKQQESMTEKTEEVA